MAKSEVNTAALVEMSELIEQLTTSGRPTLDEKISKQLKKICRLSDIYVKQAYRLTMLQLEKEHAEIRRSAAQIIDELFVRSHCFRELLLTNFQHFMELTLETDLKIPLPPPIRVAKELKKQCTQFVHNWFTKFGDAYKQLALGYNFLKSCKKMDFLNIQAQTLAEARLEEEKRVKKELRLRNAANAAVEEMNEMTAEIRSCLTEAEICMGLLVPDPDAFDIFEAGTANSTYDQQVADTDGHKDLSNSVENSSSFSSAEPSTQSENANKGNLSDAKPRTVGFEACAVAELKNEMASTRETMAVEKAAPLVHGTESTAATESSQTYEDEKISSSEAAFVSELKIMDSSVTDAILCSPEHDRNHGEMDGNDEDTVSSVEDDSYEDEDSVDDDDRVTAIRRHGILNHNTRMSITLNTNSFKIQETKDNADLLVTLRDQITLANNKFLPSVKRWLDAFTKVGQDEAHVRAALDLKVDVEAMLKKASKLNIIATAHSGKTTADESCSDEDDDFEEVQQKEGYEPHIPDCLREEYGLSPKRSVNSRPAPSFHFPQRQHKMQQDLDAEDPTSWAATLKRMKTEMGSCTTSTLTTTKTEGNEPQPSTSKDDPLIRKNRAELLKKAPMIPFGTDLYHWGDEVAAPLLVRNETESLNWYTKQELEDIVDVHALAAIKQRTINFVGKFEPVKWHCRAPLSSGKLCVRMDRYKCPFHGKVIPRNKQGIPNEPSRQDSKTEPAEDEAPKSNGWDDPALQADIFAATGIDLSLKKRKRGKGKSRQKKYANLTDIKSLNKNTARKRLEAKILSNEAIQRVAESLDELDAKRHKDKFGNNFNYSCQL